MNVAHAYVEEIEDKYLTSEMDQLVRKPDYSQIDLVCKLSQEARENMKLALDHKKDKAKIILEYLKVTKK